AADHKAKIAILKLDIAGAGLGRPAAMVTGWLDHDGFARRALAQRRFLAGLAPLVRRGSSAPIDIECPLDTILGEAVTEHRAGMVEDNCGLLAVGRPQHAPNHLPE